MMRNKPIRLFVDAHAFDAEYQGTQTFIRELYRALIDNHPEIDIYWGVYSTEKLIAALPSINSSNILPYKKISKGLLRFVVDIPAYLKKYQFDFAHFQYLTPLKHAGCRYIVTTHDILFEDFIGDFSLSYRLGRSFLFRKSLLGATIKTTVSDYSKARIGARYDIPTQKLHIIPNGVSHAGVTKEQAEKSIAQKFGIKNFILYVSRIEPRKNQLLLLQKYLKLQLYKKDIALVFIGHQSESNAELDKTVESLTIQQSKLFYWIPQVEPADLQAFYAACRVFVYPSKAEGFGIPPLEAAIAGSPVLCSNATAMADFDFFKPYTFDPNNEVDFEYKLSNIIDNPPSPAFIDRVADKIKDIYQWQRSSQLFYNLLIAN